MFCGFNFTGAGGLTAAKKSFLWWFVYDEQAAKIFDVLIVKFEFLSTYQALRDVASRSHAMTKTRITNLIESTRDMTGIFTTKNFNWTEIGTKNMKIILRWKFSMSQCNLLRFVPLLMLPISRWDVHGLQKQKNSLVGFPNSSRVTRFDEKNRTSQLTHKKMMRCARPSGYDEVADDLRVTSGRAWRTKTLNLMQS